jgi:hypothetical protein
MAQARKKKFDFSSKQISGSRPRLVFGLWMLAALLLVGHNGTRLMFLLDTPVSGQSAKVKLASEQWRRLQDKMTQFATMSTERIELDPVFFDLPSRADHQMAEADEVHQTAMAQKMVQLPALAGILRCTDIHGNADVLAVIEGQRFRANQQVDGFTIQRIEDQGVVLAKGGRQWFLKSPEVFYSNNHESDGQGSVP